MRETNMKEPKKIKLNPETPVIKEPTRYRLLPIDKKESEIDDDDEDNSKNN